MFKREEGRGCTNSTWQELRSIPTQSFVSDYMRLFGIKIYVGHFVSFRGLNRHEQVKPVQMFSRAIADHAGLGFTLRS